MKPRTSTWALLVVVLFLVLPTLIACASGGTYVEAKPQTSADLSMPDPQARAVD